MTAEQKDNYDLAVIGGGPGGYVAAIRAAQLGLSVACVERRQALGGTCLNVGCIPSKALLESSWKYRQCREDLEEHGIGVAGVSLDLAAMMARKEGVVKTLAGGIDHLIKKNRITRFSGAARLQGEGRIEVAGEEERVITAKSILLATGSEAAAIPGVEFDGERVISSTEALALEEVPRHLVVVGAGAIGLELGSVWRRLGAEVTVVEYLDRILPAMDLAVARQCLRLLKKQGIRFLLGARVEGVERQGDGCRVQLAAGDPLEADRVLLAAGRRPCLDGLGFAELGGETDKGGFIQVDDRWQTSLPGVYAVGDVIGGAMLAHKASDEGIACIERLVTGYGKVNYQAIPAIVYTHPEVAGVGETEEALAAKGIPLKTSTSFFKGNGRALAQGEADGLVKVIAHAETDRLLGVHAIGHQAGDIIAEAAAAIAFAASSEDLGRVCHAHPTLAETLREAALGIGGAAIHG